MWFQGYNIQDQDTYDFADEVGDAVQILCEVVGYL